MTITYRDGSKHEVITNSNSEYMLVRKLEQKTEDHFEHVKKFGINTPETHVLSVKTITKYYHLTTRNAETHKYEDAGIDPNAKPVEVIEATYMDGTGATWTADYNPETLEVHKNV